MLFDFPANGRLLAVRTTTQTRPEQADVLRRHLREVQLGGMPLIVGEEYAIVKDPASAKTVFFVVISPTRVHQPDRHDAITRASSDTHLSAKLLTPKTKTVQLSSRTMDTLAKIAKIAHVFLFLLLTWHE